MSLFLSPSGSAQELFPMSEPASTIPKGVLAVKLLSETNNELRRIRNQFNLRLQYGLTPKFTIWAQPMVSNHHDQLLPNDMINHYHAGPNTIYYSTTINYGSNYAYTFSGLHLYGKYRFLNFDEDDAHFRIAAYGEYTALGTQAHDEAEPHLQGDTGGAGAGLIMTYLKNRFAVSFTGGYVIPEDYKEENTTSQFKLEYGNAWSYNLSFGYLVYPKKYESYQQSNYNVYLELKGKSYDAANFSRQGESVNIASPSLQSGAYLDAYIGLQRIIRSNDRIEVSLGFPLINKSYRHFYPVLNLAWQRFIFFK